MTPEHARELLGGLAAGILTPEERQTLFDAALHDQTLFNEVADELEFSVFLQSAETRAQLANRIEVEPERRSRWALRPAWLTLSGVLAASCLLFVVLWHRPEQMPLQSATVQPSAALTPPAAPSEKKEQEPAKDGVAKTKPVMKAPAPPASIAAGEPKPAPIAKSESPTRKEIPAEETAKVSQSRDQAEATQPRQADRNRAAAGFAAPMAPALPAPAPPPPPASKAITTASLSGTVHDAAGAAIAGATVDILNTTTNTTTHATSDAKGNFVASSLPQGGPYTVAAIAPGFAKAQQSGITLSENQQPQVDLQLPVGTVAETVAVALSSAPAGNGPVTQVAVLDFANGFAQSQSGSQVADLVSNQLGNGGQVHVIDREKVQQAAQSQNTAGRPPNAQEAAALGRSIGADAVIVGRVQGSPPGVGGLAQMKSKRKSDAAASVSVTAEIIDTKQAKPPVTVSAGGASLQAAANELGNQIQSTLAQPVEGSVTRLDRDIVSVKFLSPPGLAIGARCDVFRGKRKVGELVITSVDGSYAFGKFTGGRPRTGDRVTPAR